jgi:hypothetical protein
LVDGRVERVRFGRRVDVDLGGAADRDRAGDVRPLAVGRRGVAPPASGVAASAVTTPVPSFAAALATLTSAAAAALASTAALTCAAVEVIAPPAPVARFTVIAWPATLTLSAALFAAGST